MEKTLEKREHLVLANHSSMRVGGPARFFLDVESIEQLTEAIHFSWQKELPYFILGGGSNTYFADDGIAAVVIKIAFTGVTFEAIDERRVRVLAGAGENWDELVGQTVRRGLTGLENLSFIPGSVGAAPVQNIGAYGREVAERIEEIRVFDTKTLDSVIFTPSECAFGYRESYFKSTEGQRFVITAVSFVLEYFSSAGQLETSYRDLAEYFHGWKCGDMTPEAVRTAVTEIRKNKLPNPDEVGTLGSFFKNPVVEKARCEHLTKKYPELPAYEVPGGWKIPAAALIDKVCELGGLKRGNVGLHGRQPLAIVNFGGASAREVRELAGEVKNGVKKKTGVTLVEEVRFVQ